MNHRPSLLRGAPQAAPVAVLRSTSPVASLSTATALVRAASIARFAVPPGLVRTASTALFAALPTLVHAAAAASAVASAVSPDDAEDIRDIRGPKFLLPSWLWYAVGGGALLLGLIIYGIIRWRRSRRRERVLTHFELALKRLEEIRALMQPQKAREFSIAVSDIVREYIEQRFNATATHRTTEEFLHDLLDSSNTTLAKHRALLSDFLHQCDLVKFAGMSLTTRNMESLHHSAAAFVQETAKPDEPPQPSESPDSTDTTQPLPPPAAGTSPKRPATSMTTAAQTPRASAPTPKPKAPTVP